MRKKLQGIVRRINEILEHIQALFKHSGYAIENHWKRQAKVPSLRSVMFSNEEYNILADSAQKEVIDKYLQSLSGKKVLDLCCGIGRLSNYLAEKDAKVYGIDLEFMINRALKGNAHPNIEYISESIFEFDYPKSFFDYAISVACISCVADTDEKLYTIIKKAYEALKEGGLFLMVDPFHKWIFRRPCQHSFKEIISICEENGFNLKVKSGIMCLPSRKFIETFKNAPVKPIFKLGESLLKTPLIKSLLSDYNVLVFEKMYGGDDLMKVAMLGGIQVNEPRGGVQMHIDRLAYHLSQTDDIELHLITFGREEKELKSGNLRIHVLKRRLPGYFHLPFEVLILRREILKINPDIVHAHESCMPYSTAAALLSKKYPTLLTVHMFASEIIKTERGSILTKSITIPHEKFVLAKIANIIVLSPFMKGLVQNTCNSSIYVIPNGIDIAPASVEKEDVHRSTLTNCSKILFIGMLREVKGVDILINSIPKIKKVTPIKLFILGSGPQENKLKSLIKELKIEEDVKFLGYISGDEKYSYLKSTNIFVLPSRFEPFGIVLLEAMACGKPVVASNVGGIPYIVEDGKTGLLFELGNVEDLTEKVITLLKDKELRDKMGNAGRERAKEFTWDKVAERTFQIYQKTKSEADKYA